MTQLALYNAHKRSTLDRISGKYSFRAREILRKDASRQLPHFEAAVETQGIFKPNISKLTQELTQLFIEHHDETVHVSVSDGIQEVSPENKLAGWSEHPIDIPIENTLGTELAGTRDAIVKEYLRRRKQLINPITKFVTDLTDEYLRNIRKAYTRAAADWLDHDNDESPGVDEVIEYLKTALKKTNSNAATVFRTETTNYFNDTRQAYFADNTAVDYIQLYAVTDGRISQICEDRHRFVITIQQAKLPKYKPAFHPNCRTIQRPLISRLKSDMALITAGLAMNEESFTPLPEGWG